MTRTRPLPTILLSLLPVLAWSVGATAAAPSPAPLAPAADPAPGVGRVPYPFGRGLDR